MVKEWPETRDYDRVIPEYTYGDPDDVLEAMEQVDFRSLDIALEGVASFGELF